MTKSRLSQEYKVGLTSKNNQQNLPINKQKKKTLLAQ